MLLLQDLHTTETGIDNVKGTSIVVQSISCHNRDGETEARLSDFSAPGQRILWSGDPFDNHALLHDLRGTDGIIPVDWVSLRASRHRTDTEWKLEMVQRTLDAASPDVVFVHLNNTGGQLGWELVLPCVARGLPVLCHTGAGVSREESQRLIQSVCSRARELAADGALAADVAEKAGRLVRVGGEARSSLHDYIEHLGAFVASWTADGGPAQPPNDESWRVLEFGKIGADTRREANEIRARLLQPFQALDILLQGYLVVRAWEHDEEWQAISAESGILADDSLSSKDAFDVTEVARLFRPPGSKEDRGWYWFDECGSDVAEYAPFEAAYQRKVARILHFARQRGYGQPTLRMLDNGGTVDGEGRAQGALRVSWELLRSHYHPVPEEREKSRSLLPELWRGELQPEVITKLFGEAHDEFDLAARKVEEFLP